VYIFIQLCQETWEFDEDGERYYEKIVHGEQSSHVRWQIADNLQASFLIYLHAGAKKAHRI
jgi:hypothetical protein